MWNGGFCIDIEFDTTDDRMSHLGSNWGLMGNKNLPWAMPRVAMAGEDTHWDWVLGGSLKIFWIAEPINASTFKFGWLFQVNATIDRIAFLGDVFWNRILVTRKDSRHSAAATQFNKHTTNEANDNGFEFGTTVALWRWMLNDLLFECKKTQQNPEHVSHTHTGSKIGSVQCLVTVSSHFSEFKLEEGISFS